MTEARAAEGVAAVYTAADLAELGVGPLPGAEGLPPGSLNPAYRAAGRRQGAVGRPAGRPGRSPTPPERAADAAELVDVDYDELPAVTAVLDAAADGAPLLHDGRGEQRRLPQAPHRRRRGPRVRPAAYRVRQRMTSQRIAPVALEPRGVLAYPAADGRLEVRLPTQRPHGSRNWLAKILGMPARSRSTCSRATWAGRSARRARSIPTRSR